MSFTSKPYSWAGHCRFKINDNDPDHEKTSNNKPSYDESSISQKEKENSIEWKSVGLKCQKPRTNLESESSKYHFHSLKPIKETYVCLRNENIVKNMKIRRPRCVHLYSHPLKKVTSDTARRLRALKNMKLLTFRDYGYNIGKFHDEDPEGVDPEESAKSVLYYEDTLKWQELSYLLPSRNTLRKLYVMLYCENWKVFKKLQSYARKQRNLKGFGFLPYYKRNSELEDRPHYQYDVSSLGPKLQHLETKFSWEGDQVKMRGLNKLHQLSCFTYGRTCCQFPSDFIEESDDEEEDEIFENNKFWDSFSGQLSQVCSNRKFANLEYKTFELYRFSQQLWKAIFSILKSKAKANVSITYEAFLDQYGYRKGLLRRMQSLISQEKYQGVIQILILDHFVLGRNSYNGYGLKTDCFNFDKQYLFGIENYKIKEVLSLPPQVTLAEISNEELFAEVAEIWD